MMSPAQQARCWIEGSNSCAIIEIIDAQGSTPRECGAFMAVTDQDAVGTIGGGQMEFHVMERARALLVEGRDFEELDLALGPHLGQCCGGHVTIFVRRAELNDVEALERREADAAKPDVLIFGAGHTGLALVKALAPLPLRVSLIDDRADLKLDLPENVAFSRVDDPAEALATAPAGSAFVILTHSHALDYRLADAALRLGNAAYVGMIGSTTKLARFRQWFRARGGDEAVLAQLVCPIGGKVVTDKRPAVIAALTAGELIHRFFVAQSAGNASKLAAGRPSGHEKAA